MTSPPGGGSIAAAGQQRSRQQDRGADPRAQHRIEIGRANIFGVDGKRVALPPFGCGADRADQFHQGFGIANARNIFKRNRMLGQ
jgi:hypothetical protein